MNALFLLRGGSGSLKTWLIVIAKDCQSIMKIRSLCWLACARLSSLLVFAFARLCLWTRFSVDNLLDVPTHGLTERVNVQQKSMIEMKCHNYSDFLVVKKNASGRGCYVMPNCRR